MSRHSHILFHYIVCFYSPYLKKPLGSCISVNIIVSLIIHYLKKTLEIFSFGPRTHLTSNKHIAHCTSKCRRWNCGNHVYIPIVFFFWTVSTSIIATHFVFQLAPKEKSFVRIQIWRMKRSCLLACQRSSYVVALRADDPDTPICCAS
jgi:hypothetical protein